MTQYQGVKRSPVAQTSKMNKKRVDKDMASLVMIFDKLSRPQVNSPLNPPQEEQGAPSHCFSPKALITAFFESFSSRSDADACLKHAIIFAGSFDIDLLLNHKPPDIVCRDSGGRLQRTLHGCCLDPLSLMLHHYLRLQSIAILRKNEVDGCMKLKSLLLVEIISLPFSSATS